MLEFEMEELGDPEMELVPLHQGIVMGREACVLVLHLQIRECKVTHAHGTLEEHDDLALERN